MAKGSNGASLDLRQRLFSGCQELLLTRKNTARHWQGESWILTAKPKIGSFPTNLEPLVDSGDCPSPLSRKKPLSICAGHYPMEQ